ncbi:MAG: flagellar protein FlaG [Kiloniellaceae bacterium]
MDTAVKNSGSVATHSRAAQTQQSAPPADTRAAAPERVDTLQAVPPADTAQKPALKQGAPNSALTTYKDQDSGRLIVRVYDRESGDVLIEFPPEKAFRPAAAAPGEAAKKPKNSFSA